MPREEDLIRIAKKLDKMVSRNNTEGALDLLKELKSYNMTLKLLQETRIGMSVNGIRKHCTDDEVVALAKVLIKDWKRLLDAARSHGTERPSEIKNGVGTNKPAGSPVRSPSKKDTRNKALPDPNAPLPPLPLHLHPILPKPTAAEIKKERKEPTKVRKEPPEHNAPFAPAPLHLHPTLMKHLSMEEKERKVASDSKLYSLKRMSSEHVKKDRKDTSDRKVPKRPVDAKKERFAITRRKDSSDSKPKPAKKSSLDVSVSKPKHLKSLDCKNGRKDTDSKPSHPVKQHSSDSKSDRRNSMDFKTTSLPSAMKLTSESGESHDSNPSHPGPPQRMPSMDSFDRRGKPETPKTPTTPTSPMSPSFSSGGGPLSPRLATGETIRDKCIEMLAAALRTDDNYKEFGTNCDSMAAEIEDHIYKEMGATDMKYKNRVRSRISNLKDPKNPGLRRNVLAGGIELGHFAVMSAEEMASDELKQLRNHLTKEAIREHQLSKTSGTISDLFQCSKCKKKNCTYNQVQTRSADEPMTTFVLCNECGNRWKFC
ncbi:transcription elongation factor A protein 3 isoform X10 [Esox lucius]|uniref:transcription elongation factor A protein 3 isoform X10 n=1 Tax=Esox lucius TaxID=8010 RepID=UPI0005764EC2|nr:transcription elongation factor A protein 3 isoform X10 [Esox lucius]